MVGGVPGDQVFVARVVEPVSQTSVTDPGIRTGTGNRNGSSCHQDRLSNRMTLSAELLGG